jgi:sulfatase maturation enzyme AslB (radical SAM superfamily)
MSQIDQAIKHLQKIHDTAGPFYLSDFFKPGGKKLLHDFLTSVYQPAYKNNFRILLVQDCADVYDYQDSPGSVICTLQQYASQIDISNFFILILTSNSNIAQELTQVQELYSTDNVPMQYYIVNGITSIDLVPQRNQDTFCILPWMHLYVGPDSNVLPCCVADQQYPIGSINEQPIIDIAKSSLFNTLRKNMLSGKRSKECSYCYNQEDAGLKSIRQSHNAKWSKNGLEFNSTGEIENFNPIYLDIRLNNICNLKCRMCSGYFSSAIAQEEYQLFSNKTHLDTSMPSSQRVTALKEILEYLPHAKKIYFAGGEPLITNEHYKILDELVKCGNTDLEIFYNTNFTFLTYKNISVTDIWKKFSNVTIGASIDALGSVAEYVRHGTVWSDIESNLETLKQQCPHVNFKISSVVGLLNATSLIALQQNWHATQKVHISKFALSIMTSPDHLTLQVLPTAHKSRLETQIKSHISWCKTVGAISLAKQWDNVLNYMWSNDSSQFLLEFKRLTNSLDKFRNVSLSKVLPEFSDLL